MSNRLRILASLFPETYRRVQRHEQLVETFGKETVREASDRSAATGEDLEEALDHIVRNR